VEHPCFNISIETPPAFFCKPSRPGLCDPECTMKFLLGILALLVVAASLFADYKWRQWMANRRRDRQ
jgi:hypothetical protein